VFTGTDASIRYFIAPDPARVSGASVTFDRGVRTAGTPIRWADSHRNRWLRSGSAWEGPMEEVRPGDVVWFHRRETLAVTSAGCSPKRPGWAQ